MVDRNRKKVIGAAAGVAAAATAAGLAAAKLRGGRPAVYHVRSGEEGWLLEVEGGKAPESTHRTKRQAVRAGRDLAAQKVPSRLVIHRSDDSVQKEHAYGIEE